MNIDTDTHYTPREIYDDIPPELKNLPRLMKDGAGRERLWLRQMNSYHHFDTDRMSSIKRRVDAMKEGGWDKQCLLVANGTIPEFFMDIKSTMHLVRRWNDLVSKLQDENDAFVGVAQIPHLDVDEAIEEARRAVKELGFRAIQFQGSWGDKNIEDYTWWPFFEALERLGVPLFCHGTGAVLYKTLNPYMPGHSQLMKLPPGVPVHMGFLWQAQLILTGVILGGVIEKYPNLKFLIQEVDASWVPHYMTFMDEMANINVILKETGKIENYTFNCLNPVIKLSKKPSRWVRDNFYFTLIDTTEIEIETMLPVLVNKMNMAKNLMIESDFDHHEGNLDIARRVRLLKDIAEDQKEMICGGNAAALLKLKPEPSPYVKA